MSYSNNSIVSAFNDESDEEEEMPLEAKLRMKNIGKGTPTASGPNSFGKTSQGFTRNTLISHYNCNTVTIM